MNESSFYCKPAPGERIDTQLQLAPDDKSAIHGAVLDLERAPLSGALVLLFQVQSDTEPRGRHLIAQCVTDSEGHFAFGGLWGDRLYQVKIFLQNTNVRTLVLSGETAADL